MNHCAVKLSHNNFSPVQLRWPKAKANSVILIATALLFSDRA
jgi:hypothetical protein